FDFRFSVSDQSKIGLALPAALALTKRWRRVGKRRGGKFFWPDQFLFPLQPLLKKDFDLACAILPKANGAYYRGHIRSGDGVSDFLAVQATRTRYRIGENLHARVGRTNKRVGRAIESLLIGVVHVGHFGIARSKMPARRKEKIIAVLAKVLRPYRRIGR